jgi:hypothetical protein
MSEQARTVSGLASGEEIAGSDWTVMIPGSRRTEFESVVVGEDGVAYLVTALVSAQPLAEAFATVAQEAIELDESPILAVRRLQSENQLPVESTAPPLPASGQLQNLGAMALANGPLK